MQKCRTCLSMNTEVFSLKQECEPNNTIIQLLETCVSVEIPLDDDYPQFICKKCYDTLMISYKFRIQCERAQLQLNQELQQQRFDGTLDLRKESNTEDTSNISLDSNGSQMCNKFGQVFSHNIMTHCSKRKFKYNKCRFCGEHLQSALKLSKHLEENHAHLKSIACVKCDKTFFKKENLRLHMAVHTGIKRYMCEVCGISFALANNLSAHLRLHTGIKPYTCRDCGKSFTQQASLRSHEAGHKNIKEHICVVCGAAFSRVGALRNHSKRHLPKKPFACSLCNKEFVFHSERKRHMIIHTGEKKFVCDVCGNRFNRRNNLNVHKRIHTGDLPFLCTTCGKKFNQARCLKMHLLTHQ